jgi:uncharacterized protein DUF5916
MRNGIHAIGSIILSALIFTASTTAQDTSSETRVVPEVRAMRINPHAPLIDGNLDDAIWQKDNLERARSFVQRDPDEGEPATESTLVAVVYDNQAIYFAFWNYDSEPDKIQRRLDRRDRWTDADKVYIRLDTYHDHQSGFEFSVNASGVQRDARIYNENHTESSWDGVWSSGVRMQPWGWSAEVRIPYHCLRFNEQVEQTWGVDFARVINRHNEGVRWAYTPSGEGGFTSNFGHLTGLTDISPTRHLEVLPYVVSSLETEPKHDGNTDGKSYPANMGFDIKYGLSSNLTLNAAINPDFGQVELDAPVLNLSSFETYFPERRPFFLEGADLFRTEFTQFYSRRIGRAPYSNVDDDELDYYTDYPKAATILGAAKLTGKIGKGTNIAFLNATTQEESAEYMTTDGISRSGMVEPQANYSVLRIKQYVLNNSNVGGMLTLASQDRTHPALTGSVDWRLFTNNRKWSCRGQSIFSRNDAEDVGFGFDITLEKSSGDHIRGAIGTTIIDPHLDLNRLGFMSRNDNRMVWGWFQYRTTDDWWIIRNSWNNFNFHRQWNYNGDDIGRWVGFNSHFDFTNYWSLGCGSSIQAEKYSDDETRGNGIWEWPVYPTYSWWASLNTDNRKKVSLCINPGSGSDRGGSWWAYYMGIDYRPASNIELSIGANYHRTFSALRWVENLEDTAVFATLGQDQFTPRVSASFTVHRNLSVQLSARTIIAALDYRQPLRYMGGNNYKPIQVAEEIGDNESYYDYSYVALNSTFIMRWEYTPGSTLYLVWTRSGSDITEDNQLNLGNDFDRLFSADSDNVFLIKTSYWLNL